MKKIVIVLMIALAISLVGCGDSNKQTSDSNVDNIEKSESHVSKSNMDSIQDVCKYMESKNVVSGSQTKMDAQSIGALSGFKYKDSKAEIYEFDTSSDAYKSAKETGKITISSLNYTCEVTAINGKYVLMCTGDNKESISSAFKEMK